jgi:hypothetical protein
MYTVNTLAATAVLASSPLSVGLADSPSKINNIVLVHGGFVDGSGWSHVYRGLRKDGYNVTIVQIPTASLTDDVAATKLAISQQSGSVSLRGRASEVGTW